MPCPEKFKESLIKYNIDPKIIRKINYGYGDLVSSCKKDRIATYFRRAMEILDQNVDQETITLLMDENGCCKTGARKKASDAFYKQNKDLSLKDKVPLIANVRNMGKPSLIDDKHLYILAVQYYDGERYRCACPNFNSSIKFLDTSTTYCKCCAGHFRFHYQIMLGVKLKLTEVKSSPLGSDGNKPCAFIFEIL